MLILEFYELAHLLLLPCTTKGSELKTCSCNRFLRDIYVTLCVTCHFFCDGPIKRSFIHYNNCAVGYSTVRFSCCCLYRHRALMYKQCQNSAELMILFDRNPWLKP